MCTRAHTRSDCVPGEVRRSLLGSFVRSSGGCTVTTCTRPYRHFRHPRATTSLQLDGSNWTTNGHVVIRTRHLSATPFRSLMLPLPPSPPLAAPIVQARSSLRNSNAESLTGYQSVCRVTHFCSCSSCPSTWSIFVFSTRVFLPPPPPPTCSTVTIRNAFPPRTQPRTNVNLDRASSSSI